MRLIVYNFKFFIIKKTLKLKINRTTCKILTAKNSFYTKIFSKLNLTVFNVTHDSSVL